MRTRLLLSAVAASAFLAMGTSASAQILGQDEDELIFGAPPSSELPAGGPATSPSPGSGEQGAGQSSAGQGAASGSPSDRSADRTRPTFATPDFGLDLGDDSAFGPDATGRAERGAVRGSSTFQAAPSGTPDAGAILDDAIRDMQTLRALNSAPRSAPRVGSSTPPAPSLGASGDARPGGTSQLPGQGSEQFPDDRLP